MTTESTKADEIAGVLEQAIVAGELQPGVVLRQEQLSERFAVSRTPIREALRRLAALGLVSFEPNRGVRVRTVSREELHEAFLVRAELESLATELAATRMTDEDYADLDAAEGRFSELTRALREQGPAPDLRRLTSEWVRANHAFHDVIYRAAGAPLVEQLAKSARRSFAGPAIWARGEKAVDELYERNDREHRAIQAALVARSPEGARAIARDHVLHSFRLLEAVLDLAEPEQPLRARRRRRSA
jgi:DNA-binding GntR family transcriptional regulator